MLIEFQVENFRSFKEAQTFSMVAGTQPEHARTNTFDSGFKSIGRLLRSAVIYGPNAAGKTNLLRAIQFVKELVLGSSNTNTPYPYSPFKFSKINRASPSKFLISFIQKGTRYEYGFTMGPQRIEEEWLTEYSTAKSRARGRSLFERTWDRKKKKYDWKFSSFLKGQRSVWSDSTRPDALFLSTAIQLNSKQLLPVYEWFQRRLVVIVGPTTMNQQLTFNLLNQRGGKEKLLPFLREADLGISDLSIEREAIPTEGFIVPSQMGAVIERVPNSNSSNLLKVRLSHVTDDPKSPLGLDFAEESSGTQILFNTAGAWLNVIEKGEVLLFDEIDTNLHPRLLHFLIQKFNSENNNPNHAQLICSTHNTSLLDQELFRRDQIWFVEKQKHGSSKLYPLTDFRPRNDEVLERWYLRGRYGALPILPSAKE